MLKRKIAICAAVFLAMILSAGALNRQTEQIRLSRLAEPRTAKSLSLVPSGATPAVYPPFRPREYVRIERQR